MLSMSDSLVETAMGMIESESATIVEKIEMLIELGMGFQQKPDNHQSLHYAVELYRRAIEECGKEYPLLNVRAKVGMATALRSLASEGPDLLLEAKDTYIAAIPVLQELASPEEVAEAQMNLGLTWQSLVPFGEGNVADCIQAYQQALRVFSWQAYPKEYAILHNNMAIAYLSLPKNLDQQHLPQALAVQSLEEALKRINLSCHPNEYAMLQNNLANALQYLPSTHPVENNWRAIAAYDESLKVRNPKDTPLEYANTISNKANALCNLPDNPENPEIGNRNNLFRAQSYYQQALQIFSDYSLEEQMQVVTQALQEIDRELQSAQVIN